MGRYKNYSEFLSEALNYVNLDTIKNDQITLGQLDTTKDSNKITQIKNILIPDLKGPIGNFLDDKKIPKSNIPVILNLMEKHFIGNDNDLLNWLANPSKNEFKLNPTNGGHIPLAEIENHFAHLFDKKFFEKLIELSGLGLPVVGRTELYYCMLSHFSNSTTGGDIKGPNNELIEVKQRRGRLGGTKNTKNWSKSESEIQKAFKPHGVSWKSKTKSFGPGALLDLAKTFSDTIQKLDINQTKLLTKKLIVALSNYTASNELLSKTTVNYISTVFINEANSSKASNKLKAIITAIHLDGYYREERFDWLFTTTNDRKHLCTLNCKDSNFEQIHKFTSTYFNNQIEWGDAAQTRVGASIGDIKI